MNKYEEVLEKYRLDTNDAAISRETADVIGKWKKNNTPDVLKLLYSCIDLTSLNTEDNKDSIWQFVEAVNDFEGSRPDFNNVAAICVYPNFVQTVKDTLTANVRIASVAAGFPSSQTFTEIKIAEVSMAVTDGADEIDIVLNVGEFLAGNYEDLSVEMEEIKAACRDAHLKVILETGLLKTAENIKKASVLAMYSGADFLKTSTGKVYPGASPEAVYVICQTIREYNRLHNQKIGVKVSGGIRTVEDALKYYTLVKETLGKEWLTPELFRIGASSLSQNILKTI
jgi:deoxyribose-phosphate aldolase